MSRGLKFIIRAILSVFFAILLSRFFFPKAGVFVLALVAAGLLVLAYVSEYARKGS